jgi:hypothetical protein
MQALPIPGRTVRQLKASVVLCIFRGIPQNDHEASTVWALIYHKVTTYFVTQCGMVIADFDLILHRRVNNCNHYIDNRKMHELMAVVYCRPGTRNLGALKRQLGIGDGPAEISLDWIGEIWGSLHLLRSLPPSMILLHRTPHSFLYGCGPTVTVLDAVQALIGDNPDFPLMEVCYLWMAPRDGLTGPRGLHIIWKGDMRDLHIGLLLSTLGFNLIDGHRDNPSMIIPREIISGTLVHHQFIHATPNKQWLPPAKTAWKKHLDDILSKMPTLLAGDILCKGQIVDNRSSTPVQLTTQPTNAEIVQIRAILATHSTAIQDLQTRGAAMGMDSSLSQQEVETLIASAIETFREQTETRLRQLETSYENRLRVAIAENLNMMRGILQPSQGYEGSSPEEANSTHYHNEG